MTASGLPESVVVDQDVPTDEELDRKLQLLASKQTALQAELQAVSTTRQTRKEWEFHSNILIQLLF